MCYNCGCGMSNDDMGRGKVTSGGASLTEDDLSEMAKKWGISLEETKKNIFDLISSQMSKKSA